MNEANQNPDEKTSIEIAKELRLIRRLLCVVILLLLAIVCGVFGLEFGEMLALAFLAYIIFAMVMFVYRFKSYLEERREWKKYSETPINKDTAPNPSGPVR
jgi:uncharacterized membrane protein